MQSKSLNTDVNVAFQLPVVEHFHPMLFFQLLKHYTDKYGSFDPKAHDDTLLRIQNTKESLAKAKEIITKVMERDADINPRTAAMIALLAIQQVDEKLQYQQMFPLLTLHEMCLGRSSVCYRNNRCYSCTEFNYNTEYSSMKN